jgi:hypothetical protein
VEWTSGMQAITFKMFLKATSLKASEPRGLHQGWDGANQFDITINKQHAGLGLLGSSLLID